AACDSPVVVAERIPIILCLQIYIAFISTGYARKLAAKANSLNEILMSALIFLFQLKGYASLQVCLGKLRIILNQFGEIDNGGVKFASFEVYIAPAEIRLPDMADGDSLREGRDGIELIQPFKRNGDAS